MTIHSAVADAIAAGDENYVRNALGAHPDLITYVGPAGGLLHTAARSPNPSILRVLLQAGCLVDQEYSVASQGVTPLERAITRGNLEAARVLLEFGANPNKNRTIIAAVLARTQALDFVKLMCLHHANVHAEFLDESTGQLMNALSTAMAWGKDDIAEYLRSLGCVLPGESSLSQNNVTPDEIEADEIRKYFTSSFGELRKASLRDIVPDGPRIAIHATKPRNGSPMTLFTVGMSRTALSGTKAEDREFRYCELFIQLPSNWNIDALHDPDSNWPARWMRWIVTLTCDTLGPVAIVGSRAMRHPIQEPRGFESMLVLAERKFTSTTGKVIQLYRLFPLYQSERALENRDGIAALMRAFDDHKIGFVFDSSRPSASD